MRDDTCFSCKHCEFRKDYQYPYRCKKDKTKSFRTMEAMMHENRIDVMDCNTNCKKFERNIDI